MFDVEEEIKENLAYFDDQEPDNGHRARFANRLNNINVTETKKFNLKAFYSIAAALLLLVATSYLILQTVNFNNGRNNIMVTQIQYSDELLEVQNYYDEKSMLLLDRIDEFCSSEEEAKKLKDKAQNKMDKLDANLAMIEKEYAKNPQCEKLKAAIISNKKMKVSVVDNIVEQLDFAQRGYHAGSMYTNF